MKILFIVQNGGESHFLSLLTHESAGNDAIEAGKTWAEKGTQAAWDEWQDKLSLGVIKELYNLPAFTSSEFDRVIFLNGSHS